MRGRAYKAARSTGNNKTIMSASYKILTSDAKTLEVSEEALKESRMVREMLEYGCEGEAIPVPFDSETTRLVFSFCEQKAQNAFRIAQRESPSEVVTQNHPVLVNFLKSMDRATLLKVHEAANFLDIDSLFQILCQHIAVTFISGKSAEEIRNFFLLAVPQ